MLSISKPISFEKEDNRENAVQLMTCFNISNTGTLVTEVETTLSLLPEPLRENLRRAYAAFLTQDNIADDANDELFDQYDDVFYKHEQHIIEIIQEAANNGFGHPNNA